MGKDIDEVEGRKDKNLTEAAGFGDVTEEMNFMRHSVRFHGFQLVKTSNLKFHCWFFDGVIQNVCNIGE